MSIKARLNKLESTAKAQPEIWLQITIKEGDAGDVIERLKAEAIERWQQANPDKALPREFSWIERVIVAPPPRPHDAAH
jgi:hypothetical protein